MQGKRGQPVKTLKQSLPWLLGVVFLAGGFQAWHEAQSDIVTERLRLGDRFETPVMHISPSRGRSSGALAILVHGHQCNKAMMAPLARYLAAGGIDTYSIDLPGHGESTQPFSTQAAVAAVEAAVSGILQRTGAQPQNLVLIGHSFGSLAIAPAAARRDLMATVFIGPAKVDGLTPREPSNALIVTAEQDYDFIQEYARSLYADLTRGMAANRSGDFAHRDARSWVVIPHAEHVSLLVDERVHAAVARWIEGASGEALAVKASDRTLAAARAVAFAFGFCLVAAWLIACLLKRSRAQQSADKPGRWWAAAVALGGGLFFSVMLTNGLDPLEFLRVREGDALASLIGATGIIGFAFFASMDQKISLRWCARDLAIAAAVFVCLYALAVLTVDPAFYSIRINIRDWQRLSTLALTALLAAPFFLLYEELLERLRHSSPSPLRAGAYSLGGAIAVIALVCSSLYWLDGRLFRFNAGVAAVLLYCTAASVLFRLALKDSSAGVLFSSVLAGWIVSVGFYHY